MNWRQLHQHRKAASSLKACRAGVVVNGDVDRPRLAHPFIQMKDEVKYLSLPDSKDTKHINNSNFVVRVRKMNT